MMMSCKGQNTPNASTHKHTNALINETSPYLLQHAHNPVNWEAWSTKTLEKAKTENKLLLISVGYSACHWCHVMEHESFEDSLVAQTMNTNFINVKVDREERPDVDKVYMDAVQLMTGSGGWPLNVIALPDGKPVWGGTYFPKEQWISILEQLSKLYEDNPDKLIAQAENVKNGMNAIAIVTPNTDAISFKKNTLNAAVTTWRKDFDNTYGGLNKAPKFMMPNNYHFLLRYAYHTNDSTLLNFVNLTLTKMAYGGVYDHVGGGFARYSTDKKWHVPHFEKMLYDNAQLVSLYADAYLYTKKPLYKRIVTETLDFIAAEMTTNNGAFYSAYDADSKTANGELEEGAYYVWQKDQLKALLKDDYTLFADYYNINAYGIWEHKNYVLIRNTDDATFTKTHGISLDALNSKKASWKALLLAERQKRVKPRLDDKALTAWNGLMLKGYIDAHRVLNTTTYLETALKNAHFIKDELMRKDGGLNHTFKAGESKINGYLDDYAAVIDAFIALYETTLDASWLHTAKQLADYASKYFFDADSSLYFYTSSADAALVSRNITFYDNVIPSSNSMMAKNLFKLAHYFDDTAFETTAKTMLHNVQKDITMYPTAYSNWLDLMLNYTYPFYEVAIVGKDAKQKTVDLQQHFMPNKLIAGSTSDSDMPLLMRRHVPEETLIYVCVNKACKLPVRTVDKAVTLIEK